MTFRRLKVGFLRDSGYRHSLSTLTQRVQEGFVRSHLSFLARHETQARGSVPCIAAAEASASVTVLVDDMARKRRVTCVGTIRRGETRQKPPGLLYSAGSRNTAALLWGTQLRRSADTVSEKRDVNINPGQSGPSNPGLPMPAHYSREVTFSLSRSGAESFCAEARHPMARFERTIINLPPIG